MMSHNICITLLYFRFPFSPLIIVAFDILKNSDADSRGKGICIE